MIKSNKAFISAGAALLLLKPKSKVPVGEDWSEAPVPTFDELERRCKGHNVGVRLGKWSKIGGFYLHVIDVDIRSKKHETEARAALAEMLVGYDYMTFPRVKSGSGGASFHLYFVTDRPFKSKKLAHSDDFALVFDKSKDRDVKKWNWEIELFGTGKQVAIPPSIHPETGNEYAWEVGFDPIADYPLVESTDIEVLVRNEEVSTADLNKTDVTIEEAKAYLRGLDLDYWCEDREGWIKVAMALHHEFGGSDEAFKIWCDFSRQSDKFNLREHKAQWRSFKNRGSRPTTFRTIIEAANENEWASVYDDLPGMFDDIEDVSQVNSDDVDPDRRSIPANIADEFEDLPQTKGEKASKKLTMVRKGDPDMSILDDSNEPAPEIPLDIFSPRLQKIIRDIATNAGAPLDFAFASVITVASMMIGNSVRVKVKEGFDQPAILWTQIVGGPSTNKSPAMRIPLACAKEIQNRMMGPYAEALKQWEREDELAQQYRKDFETKRKAMIMSGQEVTAELPANCISPPKPVEPLLVTNDQSIEAFYRRQAINKRGFGVSRDELAAFMADMERYGNTSNRAAWLEAFEGNSHTIERVKDEGKIIHIDHICAPLIGGIQPERLAELNALTIADDGFQARFMPFFPDNFDGDDSLEAGDSSALTAIYERLATMPMDKTNTGRLVPFLIPLTPKASDYYWAWNKKAKAKDKRADLRLQGVYGKARGHVSRLALVFEHLEWAADDFSGDPPGDVTLRSVKSAVRFREEYLRPMQKRVWRLSNETTEISIARRIANHIIEMRYDVVNARELRRNSGIKGMNSHTLAETIDQAIAFLVEKNWLFPVEQEKSARGGRPKKDFRVNPRIWDFVDKK